MKVRIFFADHSSDCIETTPETINTDVGEYFSVVFPSDKPTTISISIEGEGVNLYKLITDLFNLPKNN